MNADSEKQDRKPPDVDTDADTTLAPKEDSVKAVSVQETSQNPKEAPAEPLSSDDEDDTVDDGDAVEPDVVERARSRASSTRSRAPTIVPRSKRRGLLAQFSIIPEVSRPYDYSRRIKWTITFGVAMAAVVAPMGSSLFYPALTSMAEDFHVSATITNLTVALYMLSMSIFPLWWSSFSERLGRRSIYIVSFAFSVVFCVLSGLSVNIGMLIAMRILTGGCSASVQAVGAGTIADIWEPFERGRAMGIFYLGPLMGPLLSPIIGGLLAQQWGWRSTMWFSAVYSALVLVLVLFLLPETLRQRKHTVSTDPTAGGVTHTLSRVSTAASQTKQAAQWLKQCLVDPFQVIGYLRFPAIVIIVYYAAITFGSLYILNISVQSSFENRPYQFSEIIIGLLYIPASLGYFMASVLGGRWIDRIMIRTAERAGRYDANGKLMFLPEDRLQENIWLSATLYPGALILYGWTVQKGVFWFVPCIGTFLFGVGSMLVFGAVTTTLTEFMPKKSSNGVALNNFVRNIFSCAGGIIAQPLINVMGNGWMMTMLGLFCWVTGNACLLVLRRNSKKWRVKMDRVLNAPPQ